LPASHLGVRRGIFEARLNSFRESGRVLPDDGVVLAPF
jgi:hypothetical protein